MDDNSWTLTTVAAWWGAVVSTLTLLLGAVQWILASRQRVGVRLNAVATETRVDTMTDGDVRSSWTALCHVYLTNSNPSLSAEIVDIHWGAERRWWFRSSAVGVLHDCLATPVCDGEC